ncbi:hypothetical protein F4779DRAFT_604286 [Xylariaceae sp. FL0662B]|nr:hypothetical protein F4779DRAFT_604286 [Xylariaceae sp. FL0662B]
MKPLASALNMYVRIVPFYFTIAILVGLPTDAQLVPVESDSPNCTEISLSSPGWTVVDPILAFVGDSETGSLGAIQFSAHHSATNLTTLCWVEGITPTTVKNDRVVEDSWFNCTTPDTRFQFDLETFTLTLEGSWICRSSPNLLFNAIGAATLSSSGSDCTDSEGEPQTCTLDDTTVEAALTSPAKTKLVLSRLPELPQNTTG